MSGERQRLTFTGGGSYRPLLVLLCLAASLVWGCRRSAPSAQPQTTLRPLNLVLVTIDTLRADRLGCYGYTKIETPNLDALAARGVLFENAVASAPLTPPSHASMFTGQYPYLHGVRNTGGFVLQSSSTTLAEILQEQGWDTAAFIGASVLKKLFGFHQGFSVYDDQMPRPDASGQSREYPERPAGEVVSRAVRWLEAQSGKPFFLWVHVFDPHLPYEPPGEFRQKYRGRLYDGEVAYVDRELGRLMEAVRKKAPPQTTLWAVLSDHGESLGEHGEFTHGVFLYEETLRIPFLLAGPGVPEGKRVAAQARTIDLLPTLLDLMGGAPPDGVQGISLVPAWNDKPVDTAYCYAETLFPKMNMGWAELRAIRTNRWKYIQAPKPELYDLEQDPEETRNVLADHPGEAQQLQARLRGLLGARAHGGSEKVQTSLVDERTLRQLKTLGYLSGFSPREYELSGQGTDPKDRVSILRTLQFTVGPDSKLPLGQRIALLGKALETDPANPSLYYHLGGELEKAGRYGDAMKLYQSGLDRGIRSGRLHSRIGDLLLREGKKDEAIAAYERAAQLNPSDVESQTNLATAYLEKGRVADAERIFRWILATGEQHAAAYNGLGLIAVGRQDLTAARIHFERAVELDPDLVEAQLNLGLIYKMIGDRNRARRHFQAFVAKAPRAQYGEIVARVQEELAGLE